MEKDFIGYVNTEEDRYEFVNVSLIRHAVFRGDTLDLHFADGTKMTFHGTLATEAWVQRLADRATALNGDPLSEAVMIAFRKGEQPKSV